jgi:uncharacterized protein (TIGR03437 family)
VLAAPSTGGSVSAAAVTTDQNGLASFRWTPGTLAANQLQLAVEGAPAAAITLAAGSAVVAVTAVVSAAAPLAGMAPGSLATLYGTNLGAQNATQVSINGRAAPVLYAGPTQVNFFVPEDTALGDATVTVAAPGGTSSAFRSKVSATLPAVFPDGNNSEYGAILNAGTAETTSMRPAKRGSYVEVYCTGLGATAPDVNGLPATVAFPAVYVNGIQARVAYSGLSGFRGLYQLNVEVPVGLPAGPRAYPLAVFMGDVRGNEVKIGVE